MIPWADRDEPLESRARNGSGARSERELDILRSFARRIPEGDACAHNNLGVIYYRNGLYAEAVEQLERAFALEPTSNVAQRNLHIVYAAMGRDRPIMRVEQSGQSALHAAESKPRELEMETWLALDGHNIARYRELVGEAMRARALQHAAPVPGSPSDSPDPLAAAERGTRGTVEGLIDRLTAEPNHLPTLLRLGDLLSEAGRQQEAGVLYRRALRLDPTCSDAHTGLERLARAPGSQPRDALSHGD